MQEEDRDRWYEAAKKAGKSFQWATLRLPQRDGETGETGEWTARALRDAAEIGFILPSLFKEAFFGELKEEEYTGIIADAKARLKEYYIYTDSDSLDTEAPDIATALEEFGAPAGVRSADSFEMWLIRVGGYGAITEDDVEIARVSK